MNACCNGCNAPFIARPSVAVTLAPSCITAKVRQELIRRPPPTPTRTALSVIAPLLRTGQVEMVAQRTEQVVHGASLS